jgi:hypothetical protein
LTRAGGTVADEEEQVRAVAKVRSPRITAVLSAQTRAAHARNDSGVSGE